MKRVTDKLFWIVLVLLSVYVLYSKGYIMASFESVDPKVAYEMVENDENITLLDVRTSDEFKHDGHIAEAKLIPLGQLAQNLNMLDKSKKVLVYCRSGSRSVAAARILGNKGFTVVNMSGGIMSWKSDKLPVSMESN